MATVLITGCSSGIGLETALAFAGRGDRTYASMRDPQKATRLKERAAAAGLDVEVLALDVLDDASVAAAVRTVQERHGAVDVLVNNAGISFNGAVEVSPMERARAVLETNFWGPLRTIRAVLPAMRERRSGVIVNVGSLAGRSYSVPYNGFYAASKSALASVSEALAGEVARFGIRVVCVEPGTFATDVQANAVTREAAEGDVYAADEAWLARFLVGVGEDAPGGGEVAEAIVGAVTDPDGPLHLPVGAEAGVVLDMISKGVGFEDWSGAFVQHAQTIAGPRP